MSTKQVRHKPAVRKEEILKTALIIAEDRGYMNVTRDEIAKEMGLASSTIQYHFGTMPRLKTELMRAAVKQRNLRVVAQGLAVHDRQAMKADAALKEAARGAL